MKPSKILLTVLLNFCFFFFSNAQLNTDLPGPDPNIKVVPIGTLVIAMDNTNQGAPGYFNLRAYGLAVTLMWQDKRLRWSIAAGKAKDGTDISVNAERLYPSVLATSIKAFKAGPLLIFPQDTFGVGIIINNFNASLTANQKVNVYRTTAAVNADIRYDMIGTKPKAAIMNDGGKASIHVGYMTSALIPTNTYSINLTPSGFFSNCVTFVSEPHNDKYALGHPTLNEIVDSIRLFVVRDGGNFLAECAAIRPYENSANARFHYSLGVADVNRSIAPINNVYPNPDLSMSQFEGQFNMDDGGSLTNWSKVAGGTNNNSVYNGVKENHATRDTIGYSTSKMDATKKGGLVTYLGNHDFPNNSQIGVNGIRVFLNAFITPARYPACPVSGPLAVKFIDFKAQVITTDQVKLTWVTGEETNTKEYVIERSKDGSNFYEIDRIQAKGNTQSAKTYSIIDNNPLKGKNFYRITELDFSGNKTFSPTLYVKLSGESKVELEVFPNPAFNIVTVSTVNSQSYLNRMQVFDLAGKLVLSNNFNGNTTKINVSILNAGSFILRVTTDKGEVIQSKLVVAKN